MNFLAALGGLAGVCAGTGAVAAEGMPQVAGVIEVHGTAVSGESLWSAEGESWHQYDKQKLLAGFGAIAFALGDRFSIQFDAWAGKGWVEQKLRFEDPDEDYDDSWTFDPLPSLAAHLTWRPQAHAQLGVMLSKFAAFETIPSYTLALEGAVGEENWRLSAQAGMSWTDYSQVPYPMADKDYYVQARLAWYPAPNLSLAAGLGYDHNEVNRGPTYQSWMDWVNWELRAEYRPDWSPVTGFAAYRGNWATVGDNYDGRYFESTTHQVVAGIRLPFGTEGMTLRELDDAVGLYDASPRYGLNSY